MPNKIEGTTRFDTIVVEDSASLPAGVITNDQVAADAEIVRDKLARESLATYVVPLTQFRTWDALATNLPGTSAADDLGLATGTYGTDTPELTTGDVKAAGAVTRRARVLLALPPEYDAGEDVQLRLHAGMETTVADASATVDVEAYKASRAGGVSGSDLCATAAQSINSLTKADKDFVITAATLNPGDLLDVRVTVATSDAATATAVIATIGAVELRLDIRG